MIFRSEVQVFRSEVQVSWGVSEQATASCYGAPAHTSASATDTRLHRYVRRNDLQQRLSNWRCTKLSNQQRAVCAFSITATCYTAA